MSGGQTGSQSCRGLHTALGMLQTMLGGLAESSSSAAAVEAVPKPGHPGFIWLLGTSCCLQVGALFAVFLISKGTSAENKVLLSLEGRAGWPA